MPKKRASGEGTIYKRPDGTWVGQVSLDPDPITGKARRPTAYGKTQREVREKMAEIKAQAEIGGAGAIKAGKTTLGELLDKWLVDYKKVS